MRLKLDGFLDGVVNKTVVQMLEALGYDIELTYVKRD